jgi:ABC-type protease/lipase transport system fused ATPase/permease subunit
MSKDHGGLSLLIETLKWNYGSLLAFSAAINFLMLVPAWYMLQVYDRVLTSYDDNTLFGLSLIVLFLFLIYGLMERYRGFYCLGLVLRGSSRYCGVKDLRLVSCRCVVAKFSYLRL